MKNFVWKYFLCSTQKRFEWPLKNDLWPYYYHSINVFKNQFQCLGFTFKDLGFMKSKMGMLKQLF